MRKLTAVLLLIWLVGTMFMPVPALAADCALGQSYDGLYYTAVVDTYAEPSYGGTVTRSRNGIDCSSDYQTPAVAGGTRYYTGTRMPTMAAGYAAAPLDFWIEAVPATGFVFSYWAGSGYSGSWIVGNKMHVQYSEMWCDATGGHMQILAVFQRSKVMIEFREIPGIIYDVPSGLREFDPVGVAMIECHVAPSYAEDYQFGGWIGETYSVYPKIANPEAMSTYITLTPPEWWSGSPYAFFVQPTLIPKAPETYWIDFVHNTPDSGTFTSDNITADVGIHYLNMWEDGVDPPSYKFVQWKTVGCAASDYGSQQAWFWLTGDAPGTVTAYVYDPTDNATVFELTMAVVGSGTTSPSVGTHNVLNNSSITIKATPATGWVFSSWYGLPDGRQSNKTTDSVVIDEDLTVTAIFTAAGGGEDPIPPPSAATGIWGKFASSLGSVGLNNPMGKAFLLLGLAAVLTLFARKNPMMRVVLPLGILGVGIIGNWIPLWIVVLLALGLAVGLLKFLSKSGVTGGSSE